MLKIGEFSRLSQVTIKTLHHYDELGLIKPAHIDPSTNYRFYEVGQLPRIHRIMAAILSMKTGESQGLCRGENHAML